MKKSILTKPKNAGERRKRLVEICKSLPEVETQVLGRTDEHLAFRVRKKIFAYYLFDHHGDGRIALWCKAAPGDQGRLVEGDAERFFVPPYLGPRGWVGVRLDLRSDAWTEVAYLVRVAYRLSAPRSLLARLD